MFIDYYSILDISQSATKEEIKAAYKKQAIKWHPDKNIGKDTTPIMQDINEAYLILNDDEARIRYDNEYIMFKTHEQRLKQEKSSKNENQNSPNQNISEDEFWRYEFNDEILKKWMRNAKEQASKNVKKMILEFGYSTVTGFSTFFKVAVSGIVAAFFYFILALIIKSI